MHIIRRYVQHHKLDLMLLAYFTIRQGSVQLNGPQVIVWTASKRDDLSACLLSALNHGVAHPQLHKNKQESFHIRNAPECKQSCADETRGETFQPLLPSMLQPPAFAVIRGKRTAPGLSVLMLPELWSNYRSNVKFPMWIIRCHLKSHSSHFAFTAVERKRGQGQRYRG